MAFAGEPPAWPDGVVEVGADALRETRRASGRPTSRRRRPAARDAGAPGGRRASLAARVRRAAGVGAVVDGLHRRRLRRRGRARARASAALVTTRGAGRGRLVPLVPTRTTRVRRALYRSLGIARGRPRGAAHAPAGVAPARMALRSSSWRATRPGRSCSRPRCRCSTPELLGVEVELERHDLSLEARRDTRQRLRHRGRRRDEGGRLRAEGGDHHARGQGRRRLAQPHAARGRSTARSSSAPGRRIPGVVGPVAGVHYPIAVVRMAVGDAYGAEERPRRGGRRRGRLPHRAHHALDLPRRRRVRLPRGRAHRRPRLRRPEVDRLPRLRGHAQGGARRGGRAPPRGRLPAGAGRRDVRRA